MSNTTAKDNVTLHVTNWLLTHKESIKDDVNTLKVLNDERRRSHPRFIALVDKIFDRFSHGSNLQRTMFCYVTRMEFSQIVSDQIAELDNIVKMARNFATFMPSNPFGSNPTP